MDPSGRRALLNYWFRHAEPEQMSDQQRVMFEHRLMGLATRTA